MNTCKHKYRKLIEGGAAIAVALVILILPGMRTAMAQSTDTERLSVSLGVFLTSRNTTTQLDGQIPGSGTPVKLEDDLGFDKSDSVFRIDGYYRFNDKHRIDFSVFDLSRTATKQINRDIDWNGTFYPVNVLVDTKVDLSISKIAYTWSFMRREKGYLGLSAGLYVADISTEVAANSIGASSSGGITAPLPVVGVRGQYNFTEKWSLRGNADFFALEYGDFSGSLRDIYVGLDYQLFSHMAIGIGLNSVKMNLEISKTNFFGNLDWRYDGGLLFLKFDF